MKPVEIETSSHRFYVQRMDAFAALEAFGDLQKDILPSLGGMLALLGDASDDQADQAMTDAVANLSRNLSGKQLRYWVDRLLSRDRVSVEIDGEVKRMGQTERLQAFDDFTEILELLYQVIKLEFAGPLARWLSRLGLGQKLQGALSGDTTSE